MTLLNKPADDAINNLLNRLGTMKAEASTKTGTLGWVWKVIVGAVVIIGIGYLLWRSNKRLKELKELKIKLEQEKVKTEAAKVLASKTKTDEEIAIINKKLDQKLASIKVIDKRATSAIASHELKKAEIKNLKNWNDLDRYRKIK